jgi:hypothetical protein
VLPTIEPSSHRWIQRQIHRLDKDLAIFEIILGDHEIFLDGKGLTGYNLSLWALSQDNALISRLSHDISRSLDCFSHLRCLFLDLYMKERRQEIRDDK